MSDRQTNSDTSGKKSMKVTDRRMFTPEGELRDEYSHLESAEAVDREPPPPAQPEPPPPQAEPVDEGPEAASFFDLVSLLAEHASVYLRQASVPDAQQAQHLEICKLHIDLLGVLKDKTAGNLDAEEQAMIDDVLYRMRLAYSSQRGF